MLVPGEAALPPWLARLLTYAGELISGAKPHAHLSVAAGLMVLEAALTLLIIVKVPYTEIDFSTYLQQARVFLSGERNYAFIEGDSGPCVYPALHLYIYAALSKLSATSSQSLRPAQLVFGAVYLVNQALVMGLYRLVKAPPLLLPVLCLSKRLHSIYVLRLFNDAWTMLFVYASLLALCKRRWSLGSILFSLALGVKMNALLYAPALAVVQFRALGFVGAARQGLLILLIQLLIGLPFLISHPRAYLGASFNFGRTFLYRWTVHLRFVPEPTFLSRGFALGLLAMHAGLVSTWALWRWTRVGREGWPWLAKRWKGPARAAAVRRGHRSRGRGEAKGTGGRVPGVQYILASFFTANLVGISLARSLHYQFYAWYAQQLPLLVWFAAPPRHKIAAMLAGGLLLAVIEWAWNVFPSTKASSLALCVAHAALLASLWPAAADEVRRDELRGVAPGSFAESISSRPWRPSLDATADWRAQGIWSGVPATVLDGSVGPGQRREDDDGDEDDDRPHGHGPGRRGDRGVYAGATTVPGESGADATGVSTASAAAAASSPRLVQARRRA